MRPDFAPPRGSRPVSIECTKSSTQQTDELLVSKERSGEKSHWPCTTAVLFRPSPSAASSFSTNAVDRLSSWASRWPRGSLNCQVSPLLKLQVPEFSKPQQRERERAQVTDLRDLMWPRSQMASTCEQQRWSVSRPRLAKIMPRQQHDEERPSLFVRPPCQA